jgi:nucleotide-binding universal stress UspA family protein
MRTAERKPIESVEQPPLLVADIICGIDGTRSSYEAVRQAAFLAGAEGHLSLLVVTGHQGAGRQEASVLTPARARAVGEYARKIAREEGVAAAAEVEDRGPVAEVLLERAREHALLALGAPSMSRLAHLLIGGVASKAANELPVALLIARRRSPRVAPEGARVLVASDASERSNALVEAAARLAAGRGLGLVLMHAVHGESTRHPTRITAQARRAQELLGEEVKLCVISGRPAQAIIECARESGATLAMLGSRRTRGLRSLGSVSERVIYDADCSVLLVRPEDMRSGIA